MKFSLSWLREHLDTNADLQEIVEAMDLAGLEVEAVDNPADSLKEFSIAKVISAEKHPDADRLKVCRVETKDGIKQIVCGAPNARAGMTVAYAPLGAYIPGLDFSLDKKPRKIRGVESSGMMCSSKELQLGDDHDGIMDLASEYKTGTPLAEALRLDDAVIDFEVTPNRPDWLGVDNIARDLAATGLGKWTTKSPKPVKGKFPCPIKIKTEWQEACPVFAGRVVRGIKNRPSPKWLQDRLKSIGLKPISALVDITNYISYDRARPLHVYDMAKIGTTIMARRGRGETLNALDDKDYTCSENMCVIADENRVLGLGGVMGGTYSGVSDNTQEVFIESAFFDPSITRATGQKTGIISDARYRFERGVDTGFVLAGLEMATQMILDICGGEPSDVFVAGKFPANPSDIKFDPNETKRLTGLELSDNEQENILQSLGFEIETGKIWSVKVPSHRRDCKIPADLVEEIARIYGLHKIEAKSLPILGIGKATDLQNKTRKARRALAIRGLNEAVTWSFVAQNHALNFGGGGEDLQLANPISPELSTMRPSVLIHLLLAGQKAADRAYPASALFEAGPVYQNADIDGQKLCLAGMRRVESIRDWQGSITPDAYTAKADVLAALSAMGVKTDNLQLTKTDTNYWHGGRSARLQMGPKNILADFGELHPGLLKQMGIDCRVVAFEIWPEAIPKPRNKSKTRKALQISDLMPVRRDFAFIVPKDMEADKLVRTIKGADKALISDVNLFDIYQGKGVEEGYKSLALEVVLSPKEKTLTDKEIEVVSDKIIAMAEKTGAKLRT